MLRHIGIVAVSDITRFAASAKETNVDRAVVSTLAAITTPRFANGGIANQAPALASPAKNR